MRSEPRSWSRGPPRGKAVKTDPIKPTLKAPGTKGLKLRYDDLPSNFAAEFNLRRYNRGGGSAVQPRLHVAERRRADERSARLAGRGRQIAHGGCRVGTFHQSDKISHIDMGDER